MIIDTTLSPAENVTFDIEVIFDFLCLIKWVIHRIYTHIAFTKSKYLNNNFCRVIIFHRLLSQTPLYFQEIYLLFSYANVLKDRYSVEARDCILSI